MKVAIITDIRICTRSPRNAVSEPICILPGVDPVAAEPEHRDAGHVEDQHHGRDMVAIHGRWSRDVGQLGVGDVEPPGLEGLTDECADHPDAGDLLTQDPVHLSMRSCIALLIYWFEYVLLSHRRRRRAGGAQYQGRPRSVRRR